MGNPKLKKNMFNPLFCDFLAKFLCNLVMIFGDFANKIKVHMRKQTRNQQTRGQLSVKKGWIGHEFMDNSYPLSLVDQMNHQFNGEMATQNIITTQISCIIPSHKSHPPSPLAPHSQFQPTFNWHPLLMLTTF